jgi:hypothetical protein
MCQERKFRFCDFSCSSLRVFVVNHNRSSTITEFYQSSSKGDQEEDFFRGPRRTTMVKGKWVTCLVQGCVNYKGFVSVNNL